MAPPQPSPPTVALAFTPRGHPVLGPWRRALAREVPVTGVWGADGADLRRLCVGLAPPDEAPPVTLPLAPWGQPWRAAHSRWLRRRFPTATAVIFTRPDQSALLPGFQDLRRFYYAIDDYATYGRDWAGPEADLLGQCERVVCVSTALAVALRQRAGGGAADRFAVLPNAIPAAWRPAAPPERPAALPGGLKLPRPLAGVLGRISSRLRLDWLLAAVEREPELHWLFVGDIEWAEVDPADRDTLARLRAHPRCTLLGARPFADLRAFAAALDVAVLPYSARSTNPRGSAVRLFAHLPFYAPLLATPGCAQVEEFAPGVTLAHSAEELGETLRRWRAAGFADPHRVARWQASAGHTWEQRAAAWRAWLAG